MTAAAGAAAAAAAAARIAAARANGIFVNVDEETFLEIVKSADSPLVIHTRFGFFSKKERYVTSWKGFAFYTDSIRPLDVQGYARMIESRSVWIPHG